MLNTKPNLVTSDLDHGDLDVVANDKALAFLPGNDVHCLFRSV